METRIKRMYCLSEREFLLCVSLAGIEHPVSFEISEETALSERESMEILFSMMKSGLLTAGENETLEFIPEFSRIFTLMKESRHVILACRRAQEQPFALLYPGETSYVEVLREQRGRGYVCIGMWEKDGLEQWLEEEELGIADDLPEDLAGLLDPKRAAEMAEQMSVERFGRFECRSVTDMKLVWTLRLCRKLFYREICLEEDGEQKRYPYSLSELARLIGQS